MSKMIVQDDWSLGADNVHARAALPKNRAGQRAVREAVNFDVVNGGEFTGRIGYTKIIPAANKVRGLTGIGNELLFMDGTELKRHDVRSGATSVLRGALSATADLVAGIWNEEVFMNIGGTLLRYRAGSIRQWGVDTIVMQPTAYAAAGGALLAGLYKIAMTRINEYGEESGTVAAKNVTATDQTHIVVSNIPAPAAGETICIYASTVNGTQLYRQQEITTSMPTLAIGGIASNTVTLDTQFFRSPPTGNIIAAHHGVLLIADGNTLWITSPLRPHLCAMATGFFQFAAPITNVISSERGIYVTANETFWITDVETSQPEQRSVLSFGAVKNTALTTSTGVTWMTEFGQANGNDRGEVVLPNQGVYAPILADDAVAGIVRRNGNEMAVTVMGRNRRNNSLAVTDYFDVEVIGP